MSRSVSESLKKSIAGRQNYKCANKPGSQLRGLEKFECPLWNKKNDPGIFDESGYEIDHIVEFSQCHNDDEENLQALCRNCHVVKTTRFMRKVRNQKNINKCLTGKTARPI